MGIYDNRHVMDPTFFVPAIDEFKFGYEFYHVVGHGRDEYGRITTKYEQTTIYGSLQPETPSYEQSPTGNMVTKRFRFYCLSLYRIDLGDFIHKGDEWLRVNAPAMAYDEYGVRECGLEMVDLASYRDLADYVAYIEGKKLV